MSRESYFSFVIILNGSLRFNIRECFVGHLHINISIVENAFPKDEMAILENK